MSTGGHEGEEGAKAKGEQRQRVRRWIDGWGYSCGRREKDRQTERERAMRRGDSPLS